MSKHTPGLWWIDSPDEEYPGVDAVNQTIVVFVRGKDKETRLANARLIAAAPELLAACKAVLEWNRTAMELDHDTYVEVLAAINKAEGV